MPKISPCQRIGCAFPAAYAWQPFGPDSSPVGTMTALGSHYRGFPVLKLCTACHDDIVNACTPTTPRVLHFAYQGRSYWWDTLARHFVEAPF